MKKVSSEAKALVNAALALRTALQDLADQEHCNIDWSKLDPQDVHMMIEKIQERHLKGEPREDIDAAALVDLWAIFKKCRRPNLYSVH